MAYILQFKRQDIPGERERKLNDVCKLFDRQIKELERKVKELEKRIDELED